MKSSKLITRKALTQLMLAMVASGKAHRSDFEAMAPNDIVLLAANLIDPSMLEHSSHHVQWTVSHEPTADVNKQQPADEDPGDVSKWGSETEPATQYVWRGATIEKVYRYLQLTMDDTDETSEMLMPYSSYDEVELLCLFFNQNSHWSIRGEFFHANGYDPDNTNGTELIELLDEEDNLPDLASLFANHVFYTDSSYTDTIAKIEAETSEQNRNALIEATAKLLYVNSSVIVDHNVLMSQGMKSTAAKNMSMTKRRAMAWELNAVTLKVREEFREKARAHLGY